MTCSSHPALLTREARDAAAARRRAGENVEATHCEECGGWVIATPRTLDALEELAARIRERAGNAPGVRRSEEGEG